MSIPAVDSNGRLVRPVQCAVCNKHMPYFGQEGSEPEIKVTVELPKWQEAVAVNNLHGMFGVSTYYIHVKCPYHCPCETL